MLIKCPECGKENISDQAKSCPSCGHPIAAVTIEKTGKKWKKAILLSILACIVGIIFLVAGKTTVGILLLLGGLIGFIVSKAEAWWHHG